MSDLTKFTRIKNDILEALYLRSLSLNELRLALYVARNTYGVWTVKEKRSLKEATFSTASVAKDLGLDERNARRYMNTLVRRGILKCVEPPKGSRPGVYGLEKRIEKWTDVTTPRGALSGKNYPALSGKNDPENREKICTKLPGKMHKTTRQNARNYPENNEQPVAAVENEASLEREKGRKILNPVADHVNPGLAIDRTLVGRLEKLQNLQMPREALLALVAWFKQPFQRQLLENWLESGLDQIEQAFRQGRKFGKTAWKFVFEEAEKAREIDKHDRYGHPREIYKNRKVYFKSDGEPCDCNGIPMNYHPAHPDYAEFYGPGPPGQEKPAKFATRNGGATK